MTTLLRLGVFLTCLLFSTNIMAQDIVIFSSQGLSSAHVMDENWSRVCLQEGISNIILPFNSLDNLPTFSNANALIIASGLTTITANQEANLLLYIKSGGNLYIQTEHNIELSGNLVFKNLISKLGGYFEWENSFSSNLSSIQLINGFESNDQTVNELSYFWHGANGCGDITVTPTMEYEGNYYGFYFDPPSQDGGNIITTSDQDWIRLSHLDEHESALKVMAKILQLLLEGNPDKISHPLLEIDPPFQNCNDEIYTLINLEIAENQIEWYVNDAYITNGLKLEINYLQNGDKIYAKQSLETPCGVHNSSSDTVEFKKLQLLIPEETILTGNTLLCPSQSLMVSAKVDSSINVIRHEWYINDSLYDLEDEQFETNNINEQDIISHVVIYKDGCDTLRLITPESLEIEVNNPPINTFSLSADKEDYCSNDMAELSIKGLEEISKPKFTWYLDGQLINQFSSGLSYQVGTVAQEIYASIQYINSCNEIIYQSTDAIQIEPSDINLSLEEIGHTSCDQPYGYIEIASNREDTEYQWSTGASGNFIGSLEAGHFTVTATSNIGCTAITSYDIENHQESVIEELIINDAHCASNIGQASLKVLPQYTGAVKVSWWNAADQLIAENELIVEIPSGNFQVSVEVEGRCQEALSFEVKPEGISRLVDTISLVAKEGQNIALDINTTLDPSDFIYWKSNQQLSCSHCKNPQLIPQEDELIQYTVSKSTGCQILGYIDLFIQYDTPFFAPNAFSPNGDGKNDYFKIIPKPNVKPISDLKIFDRWGTLVYQRSDEDDLGWDGKMLGTGLQQGIYIYYQEFIDQHGKKYMASGSVTKM